MSEDFEEKYDKRVIDRKLDKGDITEEEYENYLEDLPDLEDEAEPVEAEFEVGVLDEEDDEDEASDEATDT